MCFIAETAPNFESVHARDAKFAGRNNQGFFNSHEQPLNPAICGQNAFLFHVAQATGSAFQRGIYRLAHLSRRKMELTSRFSSL